MMTSEEEKERERSYNIICTLQELINIRDCYQECLGFTRNETQ